MKNDLSVVVVSYNTKDLTLDCISKLKAARKKNSSSVEILIIDNNSTDGSQDALKKFVGNPEIRIVFCKNNEGFGKANNQGLALSRGRYVLFLNSDVLVPEEPLFDSLIQEMDDHPIYGGITARVQLKSGAIDPASHRGFPTVWRSLCYYARIEKVTAKIPLLNTIFGGYHLTHLSLSSKHEIDSPTGAFFLIRKDLLDSLSGFDEDFFMYGEDLDLAFRIKRLGYLIMYDPQYTVTHLKGQSGLKNASDSSIQRKTRSCFYESMSIFYRKHYEKKYPKIISSLVLAVINSKIKSS